MIAPGRSAVLGGTARLLLSFAVALILSACGGDASETTGEGEPAEGTEQDQDRQTVALPAGGPVDPVFPPGDKAYRRLAAGECRELKRESLRWGEMVVVQEGPDSVELYRSAAHVCLGEWDEAVEAFNRIGSPPDLKGVCARESVYAWLRPLIQAREADPSFRPRFAPSGGSSPCTTEGPTVGPTPTEGT